MVEILFIMNKLKIWLKALRAPFFTASATPVLLGSVMAWAKLGTFNWLYFFLTLIGVVSINAGTNLANDYFDYKSGNDEINKTPTPFSGGSRVIQQKLIKPSNVLVGSLVFFLFACLIGLYLNFSIPGNVILILGLIGIVIGFFYTAEPFRLGYRGFGELWVGLCLGPLVVLGAYYVQVQVLSREALLVSIPLGILVGLILYINGFQDYEADKKVGKKTSIVILGKEKAAKIYYFLIGFVYLWIIGGVIFKVFPLATLIVFLTIPLAIKATKILMKNFDKIYELLPVNAATIKLHLLVGLLLCGGYIIDKIL